MVARCFKSVSMELLFNNLSSARGCLQTQSWEELKTEIGNLSLFCNSRATYFGYQIQILPCSQSTSHMVPHRHQWETKFFALFLTEQDKWSQWSDLALQPTNIVCCQGKVKVQRCLKWFKEFMGERLCDGAKGWIIQALEVSCCLIFNCKYM